MAKFLYRQGRYVEGEDLFDSAGARTIQRSVDCSLGADYGLMGAVGSFGAMLFNLLVGFLLGCSHSYEAVFAISGLLHPLSFALILLLVRRIQPVVVEESIRR